MRGWRVKGRLEFFWKFIHFGDLRLPKINASKSLVCRFFYQPTNSEMSVAASAPTSFVTFLQAKWFNWCKSIQLKKKWQNADRNKISPLCKLRNSASSFHWLSSSIFSYCLFGRSSRISDISSHIHYVMFRSIQTLYFLWGYDPGNMSVSNSELYTFNLSFT